MDRHARDNHTYKNPEDPYKFTSNLVGSHSLEAWGLRLKNRVPKGDYSKVCAAAGIDPWAEYNEHMRLYAIQDVEVLASVWKERLAHHVSNSALLDAIRMEHRLADTMRKLNLSGIHFDTERAEALHETLLEARDEVAERIQTTFPPRYEPVKWEFKPTGEGWGLTKLARKNVAQEIYRPRFNLPEDYSREQWGVVVKPKTSRKVRDRKTKELVYQVVKDCPFVKVELTAINPGSRLQVVRRLLEMGWVPADFTETGKPKLDEKALLQLFDEFPDAKDLLLYMLINGRISKLKKGKGSWLNKVKEGLIHPTIRSCATVTFRATHADPNISQVPGIIKKKDEDGNERHITGVEGKWGVECRECFGVPEGFKMVGADIQGLEYRCWAHFLDPYDGGSFRHLIENDIDIHAVNQKIIKLEERVVAKRWLFALMYGGGDMKLGEIIDKSASDSEKEHLGGTSRARFIKGMKGYKDLNNKLIRSYNKTQSLETLDGRLVPVRNTYSALNSLLQSSGAIVAGTWCNYVVRLLEEKYGLEYGYDKDYTVMIYSHDELQCAIKETHVDKMIEAYDTGAKLARVKLKFRLPIEVDVSVGNNWAETH